MPISWRTGAEPEMNGTDQAGKVNKICGWADVITMQREEGLP